MYLKDCLAILLLIFILQTKHITGIQKKPYDKRLKLLNLYFVQLHMGRLGTLCYNSFRLCSISMFNKLPKYVRIVSSCSVDKFKSQINKHLRNIVDLPCQSGFNNSLDGGDCLNGGHNADDQAAN